MPIVCAYLKLLQCLQTLVKNNRGQWEFHHPVLIIHLKLNHLSHRNWRSLFSSILRNNITFYVQIFNNANALHTVGMANLMQSCKHNVNLICSYLFIDYNYCLRLFYPSKCQNTIDFQQLMLPRDRLSPFQNTRWTFIFLDCLHPLNSCHSHGFSRTSQFLTLYKISLLDLIDLDQNSTALKVKSYLRP